MSMSPRRGCADHPSCVTCFSVTTDADPSAMPRVLEVFALRGLVPGQLHGIGRDEEIALDLQLDGLEADDVEAIAWRLRALVCVRSVLTAEKQTGAVAAGGR